jgi:hypothetical protein
MASFSRRVLGALRLDAATFEDVEGDARALPQAIGIVIAASLAAGVGLSPSPTPAATAIAVLAALVGWLSWASLVLYLGGRLFPEDGTHVDLGQLVRTIGFSAAPAIFLALVALPWLRLLTFGVVALWMLASMVVAVRQALDFRSSWRALGVCLAGAALTLLAVLAIGFGWGPRVS